MSDPGRLTRITRLADHVRARYREMIDGPLDLGVSAPHLRLPFLGFTVLDRFRGPLARDDFFHFGTAYQKVVDGNRATHVPPGRSVCVLAC